MTANLWLPELEETASNNTLKFSCHDVLQSAQYSLFASCLIFVVARRTLNFPPLQLRCCCSNLFLSTQNATWYAVYVVLCGGHKYALSRLLPNPFCSKTWKTTKQIQDCLFLWRFWSYSAGSNRKYSRVRDDIALEPL